MVVVCFRWCCILRLVNLDQCLMTFCLILQIVCIKSIFVFLNLILSAIIFILFSVFVMTAADPRESSYACYYDKLRGTYLGDVFSVKWMEDSDKVIFSFALSPERDTLHLG